eukprot:8276856-Lingulodinium_polyedra.AAC.1
MPVPSSPVEDAGVPATAYTFGIGRLSPQAGIYAQEVLAMQEQMKQLVGRMAEEVSGLRQRLVQNELEAARLRETVLGAGQQLEAVVEQHRAAILTLEA